MAGFVTQARSEFSDVPEKVPEGQIGLGQCDLMLAAKAHDATKINAARSKFKSIQGRMNTDAMFRKRSTRDGLVDYYSGLGKAFGASGQYNADASNAFKASYQYAPTWPVPMTNMLASEAMRLSQTQMTDKQLAKERPDLERFRAKMNVAWRGNAELYSGVKDAWLQFTMAMAKANADAGNLLVFGQLMYEIQHSRDFSDRYEPLIFQATILFRDALQPGISRETKTTRVAKTDIAYTAAIQSASMAAKEVKDLRAAVYNNSAWCQVFIGDANKNTYAYKIAMDSLMAAILLQKDSYDLNRNIVVVMKRQRLSAKKYQEYLERAGELKTDKDAEDFRLLTEHAAGR